MALVMFAVYAFSMLKGLKAAREHGTDSEDEFAFICFSVMVLLVICGFIASAVIRPVFVYRYMIPACGLWWLAFAVTAGRQAENGRTAAVRAVSLLFTVVLGVCSFRAFTGNEQYKLKMMAQTDAMLSEIKPGTRIVCNFGQVQAVTAYGLNKIHDIEEELPDFTKHPEEKKQCEYLYIEADEDHIHRQKENKENGCYIGKLIYVFEGKKELCEGRKELIAPFYFAGIYAGSDANAVLWERVEKYITDHYDQDYLKQVYINSDGGTWIKSAADHIYKGCMVADRFHLMKYINHVARCTLDSADTTKQDFYKSIYKDDLDEIEKLLTKIKDGCDNSDQAVDKCRTYLENNWIAIQKAFHDKNVLGCSAESHVSNVLSERMSSRPMAWSEIGTDRMCKLRCFIRNYGSDKVIDLVKYRREKEMDIPAATGTEGISIDPVQHKKYTAEQLKEYEYAKRLHGTLGENTTVHKILAIRNQLGNI
jgi:hypothetical protein